MPLPLSPALTISVSVGTPSTNRPSIRLTLMTEDTAVQATEVVTERATEGVTEHTTEVVMEKVTEWVTEQVTGQVTNRPRKWQLRPSGKKLLPVI